MNIFQRIKNWFHKKPKHTKPPKPTPVNNQTLEPYIWMGTGDFKIFHYTTQAEATKYFLQDSMNEITIPRKVFKPFFDIRYTNPIKVYSSVKFPPEYGEYTGLKNAWYKAGTNNAMGDNTGCVVQMSKNKKQVGLTTNLWDAPSQQLEYGGIASTFTYIVQDNNSPWEKGNLVLQARFNEPVYLKSKNNYGGGICFGLFLKNKKNGLLLNYVITLYGYGNGKPIEQKNLLFDTTTHVVHIQTSIVDGNLYCTKSPYSLKSKYIKSTFETNKHNNFDDFYRVNVSYDNLKNVLKELKRKPPNEVQNLDFGNNPKDWVVTLVVVQQEIEESGGKGRVSSSFSDFGVYLSETPA